MAATWDPELARRYGDLVGDEAFDTGHNVLLGPSVDIVRNPFWAGPSSRSAKIRC